MNSVQGHSYTPWKCIDIEFGFLCWIVLVNGHCGCVANRNREKDSRTIVKLKRLKRRKCLIWCCEKRLRDCARFTQSSNVLWRMPRLQASGSCSSRGAKSPSLDTIGKAPQANDIGFLELQMFTHSGRSEGTSICDRAMSIQRHVAGAMLGPH